jgi:WD40 repeat protein
MANSWPVPPSTGLERVIDDRYRVRGVLGSGALGEVYYAEDLRIHPSRQVAIKLLHSELLDDEESIQEFSHEALILRRLYHPNIQRLLDFQVKPDLAYLVTEYAPGGSLENLICPDPNLPAQPLPLEQVDILFEQIVAAVDYLHGERIIHRDLKPANILLNQEERPVLADFSLGAFLNSQTPASLIRAEAWGTPLYAAPEVWEDRAGKASDIYALAIILFQLISGQTPFQGTPEELKKQHRFALIPALSEVAPGLDYPPELDNLFLAALAKDPAQRIATAKELYRRFKAILTDNSGQKSIVGGAVPISVTSGGVSGQANQPASVAAPAASSSTATTTSSSFISEYGSLIIVLVVIPAILLLVLLLPLVARNSPQPFSVIVAAPATATPRSTTKPVTSNTVTSNGTSIAISHAHQSPVRGISWYLAGSLAFYSGSDDQTVRGWTFLDGVTKEGPMIKEASGVNAMAISPDGSRLATALANSTVELTDSALNYLVTLKGHTGPVNSVAWSPDGKLLATASADHTTRIWDAEGKWRATLTGHTGPVNSVAWSPDGKFLATASNDATIKVWSADGTLQLTFGNHLGPMLALAWSPDGRTIASSSRDGFLYLWTNMGGLKSVWAGHTGPVFGLAWAHNGKRLATASEDQTVKLWDPNGKLVTTLKGDKAGMSCVAWSLDDGVLAAGDRAGAIWVWQP